LRLRIKIAFLLELLITSRHDCLISEFHHKIFWVTSDWLDKMMRVSSRKKNGTCCLNFDTCPLISSYLDHASLMSSTRIWKIMSTILVRCSELSPCMITLNDCLYILSYQLIRECSLNHMFTRCNQMQNYMCRFYFWISRMKFQ
jgi:hypothetical protein